MKTIEQTVRFSASPATVYETLIDSREHAAFTGEPAEISREVGGAASFYGGARRGRVSGALASQLIERGVARDAEEPSGGIVRRAGLPVVERAHVGLLDGGLGEVEPLRAEHAPEARHDGRVRLTKHGLERARHRAASVPPSRRARDEGSAVGGRPGARLSSES
jgi:hypothetical protein